AGPPWLSRLAAHVRRTCAAGRKLLIFVPSVRLAGELPHLVTGVGACRLWTGAGRARTVSGRAEGARGPRADLPVAAGVHAQDPERREKVRALEEGGIDVLVSTTLLERGVTIARLDVLVFAAHC